MTPAERELLLDVARAVRAMLAEADSGVMVARAVRVRLIDAALDAVLRETPPTPPRPA